MEEGLYYSYSDECKRNFITNQLNAIEKCRNLDYYSISSVIFEADYYKEEFEARWKELRERYNICSTECLHFAEYKKLFSKDHIDNIKSYFEKEEERRKDPQDITYNGKTENFQESCKRFKKELSISDSDISAYKTFYLPEEDEVNSRRKLKKFFLELKEILESSRFVIINTDHIIKKRKYVNKGKKNSTDLSNLKSSLPDNIAKSPSRITFKKQLDLIIEYLLTSEIGGDLYLNQNMTDKRYIKLRFDADGKNFDEKTNLKMAFNEALTIGTERFLQETAAKLLDEIRFIRKEEVGSEYTPPHCGGELVDFICSIICTITRFEILQENQFIEEGIMDINNFTTFKFIDYEDEDNEGVNFYDILKEKLFSSGELKFF